MFNEYEETTKNRIRLQWDTDCQYTVRWDTDCQHTVRLPTLSTNQNYLIEFWPFDRHCCLTVSHFSCLSRRFVSVFRDIRIPRANRCQYSLISTYLGLPRRAAWCRALNPLLFVSMMSALWSSSSVSMSSRFFEMASCSGVSPSESCNNNMGHV